MSAIFVLGAAGDCTLKKRPYVCNICVRESGKLYTKRSDHMSAIFVLGTAGDCTQEATICLQYLC